jgi:RNA-directed DNA polymerase
MYSKLCSLENLLLAFERAKKGKTKRYYVKKFQRRLKENLLRLRQELITQTYNPFRLKTFIIRDPKTRKISKSRFRDRVVHHVLINIIEPLFDKSFIYDSYANQIGKGTLKAIERFDYFKRKVTKNNTKMAFCLKADIKHYFEEVDHEILISLLSRKIQDEKVLWLTKKILLNYEGGANEFLQKRYALRKSYLSIFC